MVSGGGGYAMGVRGTSYQNVVYNCVFTHETAVCDEYFL